MPEVQTQLEESLRKVVETPETEMKVRAEAQSFRDTVHPCMSRSEDLVSTLRRVADTADSLVNNMDFRFLRNPKRKLLSIGYNVTTQKLERACYDLLASEARTATFIAIAKGDIQQQSWFRLGRPHMNESRLPFR